MTKRLAKLTGGVAVLYVGAATEVEMKEKIELTTPPTTELPRKVLPRRCHHPALDALSSVQGVNEDESWVSK